METILPDIEEGIPLPKNATEALPNLTPTQELEMRARTIKLISDLNGEPILPTRENQVEAEDLARQMMTNPQLRPDFARYPNETMAYLAGMVAQSNCMLVDELSDLKMYVVNRLIMEIEEAKDAKSRIAALSKLGEVDGVDAFKKRTEMTVKVQPMEEVEKELLSILEGVEYKVVGDNRVSQVVND